MLKLQRARKGPTITIRLREKDRLLDRYFLRALTLAVFLHLFGFFTFSLKTTPNDDHLPTLTPIRVVIDLGYDNTDFQPPILPLTEGPRGALHHYVSEPQPPSPNLPPLPISTVVRDVMLDNAWDVESERFAQLSTLPYTPEDVVFPFEQKRPILSIRLSSPLSERTILQDGCSIATQLYAKKGTTEQIVLTYKIKVADDTGEIFWWEEQSAHAEIPIPKEARQLATTVLEAMQFAGQKGNRRRSFITEGRAEILLEVDAQKNSDSPWCNLLSLMLKENATQSDSTTRPPRNRAR